MKICVVKTQTLFEWDSADVLAERLAAKLTAAGHCTEVVRIPFQSNPIENIAQHLLAFRLLDLRAGEPDLVIALQFPAYLAPFANKKVWLLRQFRPFYDLWDTPGCGYPVNAETQAVRRMVIGSDTLHLPQATAIYPSSKQVADGLRQFNGIAGDGVLYPPLAEPELFHGGETGDYFFCPGGFVDQGCERQTLALEAMRHVRSGFKLVLAGHSSTVGWDKRSAGPPVVDDQELVGRRCACPTLPGVTLLGPISDQERARWISNALAVLHLENDEDAGGQTILEAFHSHKPVIALADSCGPRELIEAGHNGLIAEPRPEALAEAMERLWNDRTARDMGEQAHRTIARHGISWDHVIERLAA